MEPSYRMWNLISTQSMGTTLFNQGKTQILAANVLFLPDSNRKDEKRWDHCKC